MCGIGGIFYRGPKSADLLSDRATAISATMQHRGPDDGGHWVDPESGLALSHRRLSIIDLSEHGHQPMVSQDGRFVMAYNGEIYNHHELKKELDSRNVVLAGHSDTEIALEYIARFGLEKSVPKFVGMFAIAIWSTEEKCLYLIRDRVGIKPLYYGHSKGAWIFASELKAVNRIPERPVSVCSDALGHFMRFGYVPDDRCIFSEMKKVAPGQCVRISLTNDKPSSSTFWSLRDVIQSRKQPKADLDPAVAADLVADKLSKAVERRMIADVPVGAFLSGGIDSSIVVSMMKSLRSEPVHTFTIGFQEKEFDESSHAREISKRLGTHHTELIVKADDALDLIGELPKIYDEPFADASQLPTILVSRLAAEHVKVALSGDGGDELFGGYTRYVKSARLWRLLGRVPLPARKLAAQLVRALPRSGDVQHNFLRLAAVTSATDSIDFYRMAVLLMDDGANIVRNDPRSIGRFAEARSVQGLTGLDEEMMYTDFVNYLPGDILTKVDRASMSTSLEVRVPLLDHEFVEAVWSISTAVRGNATDPKKLLKSVLYRYLEPSLFDRPKAGFGIPLASWLRGPLRSWAEELFDTHSSSAAELLNFSSIQASWKLFLDGKDNQVFVLWNVLMFLLWRETWCADANV